MIVRVFRTLENGGAFKGTAFFVGARRLVTCAHVAVDEVMRLQAEDGTEWGLARRTKTGWPGGSGEKEDDWAVLDLDGGPARYCSRPLIKGPFNVTDVWRASGFSIEAPDTDAFGLGGEFRHLGARLQLRCTDIAGPDAIESAGASGSPVVVNGRVVGVFASGLAGDEAVARGGTAYAVRITDVPYLEAQAKERVDALIRWLKSELTDDVMGALGHGMRDKSDVAEELVHEYADRLLPRLREAADRLIRQRDALDCLIRIALRLVPIAIDWKFRRVRLDSERHIELSVCTDTMAELIMAGLDQRTVCFRSTAGDMQPGASALSVNEMFARIGMEPDDSDRARTELVSTTVDHLAGVFSYSRFSKTRQLRLIENKLRKLIDDAGPDRDPPYYLVFEEPSALWGQRDELNDEERGLPSLRLVCLSGDDATLEDEHDTAMVVHAILFANTRDDA